MSKAMLKKRCQLGCLLATIGALGCSSAAEADAVPIEPAADASDPEAQADVSVAAETAAKDVLVAEDGMAENGDVAGEQEAAPPDPECVDITVSLEDITGGGVEWRPTIWWVPGGVWRTDNGLHVATQVFRVVVDGGTVHYRCAPLARNNDLRPDNGRDDGQEDV